jgi:hypothetical protein
MPTTIAEQNSQVPCAHAPSQLHSTTQAYSIPFCRYEAWKITTDARQLARQRGTSAQLSALHNRWVRHGTEC